MLQGVKYTNHENHTNYLHSYKPDKTLDIYISRDYTVPSRIGKEGFYITTVKQISCSTANSDQNVHVFRSQEIIIWINCFYYATDTTFSVCWHL